MRAPPPFPQILAIDHLGAVYIVGQATKKTDFDPGPGEDFKDPGSRIVTYVTKFDR